MSFESYAAEGFKEDLIPFEDCAVKNKENLSEIPKLTEENFGEFSPSLTWFFRLIFTGVPFFCFIFLGKQENEELYKQRNSYAIL